MSDLEILLACLLGPDSEEMMSLFGADAARAGSPASKHSGGKTRRNPQQRAFKSARKAVREDDFVALSKLVKSSSQANWYASDRAWCLLDEAVKSGSSAMVQWLLEKGANPNTLFLGDKRYDLSQGLVPGIFFSPFATAISKGDKPIVQLMLTHGADIYLPIVYENKDDYSTCRDIAEMSGMWPFIEAFLIGQAANDAVAASNPKRI